MLRAAGLEQIAAPRLLVRSHGVDASWRKSSREKTKSVTVNGSRLYARFSTESISCIASPIRPWEVTLALVKNCLRFAMGVRLVKFTLK